MTLTIRPAALEEAPIVHDVMVRAFDEYSSLPNPSSALRESLQDVRDSIARGGALLAWIDGRPVASVRYHADDELELLRLSVVPKHRGEGIGQRLVDAVEAIARDLGYDSVRVYARSQQPDNRPWWVARGYSIDGYSGRYGIPDLRTHLRKKIL